MQNTTGLLTSPETTFHILFRGHTSTRGTDCHTLFEETAGNTNKTLTCFRNENHAFTGVSARTFEGALKSGIGHHGGALMQLGLSPGPLPLQDNNLIGHKNQSNRREDDEENQKLDQSGFIV